MYRPALSQHDHPYRLPTFFLHIWIFLRGTHRCTMQPNYFNACQPPSSTLCSAFSLGLSTAILTKEKWQQCQPEYPLETLQKTFGILNLYLCDSEVGNARASIHYSDKEKGHNLKFTAVPLDSLWFNASIFNKKRVCVYVCVCSQGNNKSECIKGYFRDTKCFNIFLIMYRCIGVIFI